MFEGQTPLLIWHGSRSELGFSDILGKKSISILRTENVSVYSEISQESENEKINAKSLIVFTQ